MPKRQATVSSPSDSDSENDGKDICACCGQRKSLVTIRLHEKKLFGRANSKATGKRPRVYARNTGDEGPPDLPEHPEIDFEPNDAHFDPDPPSYSRSSTPSSASSRDFSPSDSDDEDAPLGPEDDGAGIADWETDEAAFFDALADELEAVLDDNTWLDRHYAEEEALEDIELGELLFLLHTTVYVLIK